MDDKFDKFAGAYSVTGLVPSLAVILVQDAILAIVLVQDLVLELLFWFRGTR